MNLITREDRGVSPLVGDLTGKVLVIAHTRLNRRYQSPRFQLFKAYGGFGCKEGTLGSAVFGKYLADEEDDRRDRHEFIGIADDELIKLALADTTPVIELDPKLRQIMLVCKDGHYQFGDTAEQARQRLNHITKAEVIAAFEAHPETTISDMGFMTYPKGCQPVEVKLKKGKEWTVTN